MAFTGMEVSCADPIPFENAMMNNVATMTTALSE